MFSRLNKKESKINLLKFIDTFASCDSYSFVTPKSFLNEN